MVRSISFIFLLALSISTSMGNSADSLKVEEFKKQFITTYWEIYPSEAIFNGYFKNDKNLVIPDKKFFQHQKTLLLQLQSKLNTIKQGSFTASQQTDLLMMRDRVEAGLWYLEEFRDYEWNPAIYNTGGEFVQILNTGYKSLDERLRVISGRLANVESYFSAAKQNIVDPVKEHTDLAILQNKGSLYIFDNLIPDSVAISGLSSKEKQIITGRIEVAKESINSYVEYLRKMRDTLTVDNSRSFHLGRALYEKKFKYDLQSKYTASQIYEIALSRKKEINERMGEIAKELWNSYFKGVPMPDDDREVIRKVISQVSLNHVHADSFIVAIEKQIPELIKFVNEKQLIYLDPSKPLVVRRTPGFMEGSGAGASISAPGPYDANGKTFYNVSPLTGYEPEKAESYLREYNNYTLQILNIHEAIPGHYAQLVYANQSPSLIKSILGNGAMVEGWAVYTERMMLEEGYGNNLPEMWLMYYKWHLRSVCNTILDYSVHVENWPEKVAMKFLIDEAFQEPAEAEGKWVRVKLTQVQLCSYFTGYAEIYELRNEMKKMKGENFNLKDFHEKFLSFGSAPVKYISEQMTNGK